MRHVLPSKLKESLGPWLDVSTGQQRLLAQAGAKASLLGPVGKPGELFCIWLEDPLVAIVGGLFEASMLLEDIRLVGALIVSGESPAADR